MPTTPGLTSRMPPGYAHAPKFVHWKAARRIKAYLKVTSSAPPGVFERFPATFSAFQQNGFTRGSKVDPRTSESRGDKAHRLHYPTPIICTYQAHNNTATFFICRGCPRETPTSFIQLAPPTHTSHSTTHVYSPVGTAGVPGADTQISSSDSPFPVAHELSIVFIKRSKAIDRQNPYRNN